MNIKIPAAKFLINKISEIPIENIGKDEIDLFSEISRYCGKDGEFVEQGNKVSLIMKY